MGLKAFILRIQTHSWYEDKRNTIRKSFFGLKNMKYKQRARRLHFTEVQKRHIRRDYDSSRRIS